MVQIWGGGTDGSDNLHIGESGFNLKQFDYYNEPLNFLIVKNNVKTLKNTYSIVECNEPCVDTSLFYVKNGLLDEDDAESDNAEALAEEHIEDFVNLLTEEQMNQGNKGFDYFVDNFGQEETMQMVIKNNLIDIYKASKDAVQTDGIAHFLSRYDGETLYLSDGYVAYRNN